MSLIVAEVYEALIEAGASKEKAKAAAGAIPLVERLATREVVASLEKEMATKADIAGLAKATKEDIAGLAKATKEDIAGLAKATKEDIAGLAKATKEDIANSEKATKEDIAGLAKATRADIAGLAKATRDWAWRYCPPGQSRSAHGQETRGTQSSGLQLYPGCPDAVDEARFLPVGRISEA